MKEKITMVVETTNYKIKERGFVYRELIERVVDRDSVKQYVKATWLYKAQDAKFIHFKYNQKTSRLTPEVLEDYVIKMDVERLLQTRITINHEEKDTHDIQLSTLSFKVENME